MSNQSGHSCSSVTPIYTRRGVLSAMSLGFGWLAFSSLLQRAAGMTAPPVSPLAPKVPPLPASAKRVIFLTMRGGPSHVDTFDYKPKLITDTGKAGKRPGTKLLGSKWNFKQSGKSGLWISELFPSVAKHADEMCLIRSMQTDLPSHPQAFLSLHTGTSRFVRPSLGAWTTYGLGTTNENLPGFVTITPPSDLGGAANYGSSFLPAIYQGTRIGSTGRQVGESPVRNLDPNMDPASQRAVLDLAQSLNRQALEREHFNPDVEGVIQSYELAYKMQAEMPKVMDLSKESDATRRLYGIGDSTPGPARGGGGAGRANAGTDDFGRKCLLARRMLQAGVRFVEISHGNWDQHTNLETALAANAHSVDQPIAALLADLKSHGMLKDTLVVWAGEFGRTPHAQGGDGRDHNNKAFTIWMAGGGIKGGTSYGSTDDYGYEAVENKVQIHDLHATILALLGLDHEKLTFKHAGRDFRLTDTAGNVVREIIA
ncbi:MAG: DUF1501 domain-containing protein [Planctomycetota bacterium]